MLILITTHCPACNKSAIAQDQRNTAILQRFKSHWFCVSITPFEVSATALIYFYFCHKRPLDTSWQTKTWASCWLDLLATAQLLTKRVPLSGSITVHSSSSCSRTIYRRSAMYEKNLFKPRHDDAITCGHPTNPGVENVVSISLNITANSGRRKKYAALTFLIPQTH